MVTDVSSGGLRQAGDVMPTGLDGRLRFALQLLTSLGSKIGYR
jgi:hypothetical protein